WVWVVIALDGRRSHPFNETAESCQSFSGRFYILLNAQRWNALSSTRWLHMRPCRLIYLRLRRAVCHRLRRSRSTLGSSARVERVVLNALAAHVTSSANILAPLAHLRGS